MKKLFKKIKCFILKLLGKCDKKDCCKKPNLTVVPKPEKPSEPVKPEAKPEPEHHEEASRREPDKSFPRKAKVQSFLWKPEGDHTGKPVVLIGCDALRSEDLSIEIHSAKGRKLKVGIRNSGRANQLHPQKYGRVHFRLDRKGKDLAKKAPLKVVIKTGDTVLKEIKIKDPTKRIDQK